MHYSTARNILIDLRYLPLPIIPRDKRPATRSWVDPDYVPPMGYGNYGVGIVCGRLPFPVAGVDLDITDKDLAKEMLSFVSSRTGATAYRIGRAPKTLVVCRHDEPRHKIMSKKYSCGRVEILGTGQQFVAFGTHPDTKQPYSWPQDSILDIGAANLPVITAELISEIIEQFETLAELSGYEPEKKGTLLAAGELPDYDPDDPLDRIEPVGLSMDDCKKMLAELDPDCSRDEWRNIGMALHHEYNGSEEAREIWDEWSAGGSKYKSGEPEKQWESFGKYRGRPITAAYLLKLTKKKEDIWEEPDFFKKLNWSTSRFVNDPPEVPMVIYNFLPRGIVSLFYSAGGAGKSTIVLYMACKVAIEPDYSTDFLGHAIQGGSVVIVTAEDPDLILNRRFIGIVNALAEELDITVEEARCAIDKRLKIVSTFGHSIQLFKLRKDGILAPTEYYKSLVGCLKEIDNLHLVIVDTKTRYSPGEGEGNVTATQEIAYYEAIAKVTSASVMLLHHTNKSSRDGSQSGATAYRDASAIFDSVRAAWYLRGLRPDEIAAQDISEDEAGSFLYLENSKNNYIQVNSPVIVHRTGYKYTVRDIVPKLSAAEKKEKMQQLAYDTVIGLIQTAKGPVKSQADILTLCREQRIGRIRTIKALDELVEDGLIERRNDGNRFSYSLTEEGMIYQTTIKD